MSGMKARAKFDSGKAGTGGLWLHTVVTTASGTTFRQNVAQGKNSVGISVLTICPAGLVYDLLRSLDFIL